MTEVQESNLVKHARRELELAGMFDKDSDYGGAIGSSLMDVVRVISDQEHSGGSIWVLMTVLNELTQMHNLTPLTSDPDEWYDVSELVIGDPNALWQNIRRSSTFSRDGGKTWYDIEDATLNNGDVWRR